MKIELLKTGDNILKTISLVRIMGEMSLYDATKTAENLPASFMCNRPDEDMPEILKQFEEAGAKVEFITGIEEKKSSGGSNYIAKVLFPENKEEKEEQKEVRLKKFTEIKDYLVAKSSIGKAFAAAVIGTIFLTVIISMVYSIDGERAWWYDVLVGAAIGFSVKYSGKGIDGRFGLIAAGFTLLTLVFLQISYTIIFMRTEHLGIIESFRYVKPDIGQIIRSLLAAYLAFSLAFTLAEKKMKSDKIDLSTSEKIKEYILSRKKDGFKEILGDNKSRLADTPLFLKSAKSKKEKSKQEKLPENLVVQE